MLDSIANTDLTLHSVIWEVYTALNSNLHVLTAIGTRTVFDRASELLGVKPSLSFKDKLDEAFKQGKIGSNEKDHLVFRC